jgi:hypothetical protein
MEFNVLVWITCELTTSVLVEGFSEPSTLTSEILRFREEGGKKSENNDISTFKTSTFTMAPAATGAKKQKKKWYVLVNLHSLMSELMYAV